MHSLVSPLAPRAGDGGSLRPGCSVCRYQERDPLATFRRPPQVSGPSSAAACVMDTKIPGNLPDLLATLLHHTDSLQLELTCVLPPLLLHETPPAGNLSRVSLGVHETQGGPLLQTILDTSVPQLCS